MQSMEGAYQRQMELLEQARRSAADFAAHRRRLEVSVDRVDGEIGDLQRQAEHAVEAGRDDIARALLTRQAEARRRRAALSAQHRKMAEREDELDDAIVRLHARTFDYRLRLQELKAGRSAAQTEIGMHEALRGSAQRDSEAAMQQAAAEVRQLEAKAAALRELSAGGPAVSGPDQIREAFDQLEAAEEAERTLDGIKAKLALERQVADQDGPPAGPRNT